MSDTSDEFWMRRALAEAARGQGAVEPNPMVGAVVVRDGTLVGVGHHEKFGGPHAERHALERAGEAARGATLYVTLEPCCHHGKTPPCTDAVVDAGISRVVAAMRDPFPRVAGGGFQVLRQAGIQVDIGICKAEARALNAPYLRRLEQARPWVIAKWAMTLDGKIAARTGQSAWISSDRSRALVHELRGRVDAIVVGIGTALADDPLLTARPAGLRTATRVVFDKNGRLPVKTRLVQTNDEAPVLVVAGPEAPEDRVDVLRLVGCEVLQLPGRSPLPFLQEMAKRNMTNILVEGGGTLLGSFFDHRVVDEVDVFIAPIIEGGRHEFTPVRGQGVNSIAEGLRLKDPVTSIVDGDVRIQGRIPLREHGFESSARPG